MGSISEFVYCRSQEPDAVMAITTIYRSQHPYALMNNGDRMTFYLMQVGKSNEVNYSAKYSTSTQLLPTLGSSP